MNGWRKRLWMFVGFTALTYMHSLCTAVLPNTPIGMLLFHGSAALCEFFLIVCISHYLEGGLSDDMQTLSLVSMLINFVGWILYMAYAPPIVFNTLAWGVSCVQFIRLIIVDGNYADSMGNHLVWRNYTNGKKLYFGASEP